VILTIRDEEFFREFLNFNFAIEFDSDIETSRSILTALVELSHDKNKYVNNWGMEREKFSDYNVERTIICSPLTNYGLQS